MCTQQKIRKNYKIFFNKNCQMKVILISNTNRRFEFVYYIFFRKLLKYFLKRSKKRKTNFLCFINLIGNY